MFYRIFYTAITQRNRKIEGEFSIVSKNLPLKEIINNLKIDGLQLSNLDLSVTGEN